MWSEQLMPLVRLHYCQDGSDLFHYFKNLANESKLPNFEDLEQAGKELYRKYTSSRAQQRAMYGPRSNSNPATASDIGIPLGTAWTEPHTTPPTQHGSKKKISGPAPDFKGDQVLAQSIVFMRDTMISHEAALASAEGNAGRLYEAIKVMLFTFAGSSHSNYTGYLLEMIVKLELESSSMLKQAILRLSLVNLRGEEGHFSTGDFIQEYFNRLLESIVQKKGVEYGDHFIRNIWSRNLHHVARLKSSWLNGIGLSLRSNRHTKTKTAAEIRILMQVYRESELHSFRSGRIMDENIFIDDFQTGAQRLREGKLKKWIIKTTRSRGLQDTEIIGPLLESCMDLGNESDNNSEEDDDAEPHNDSDTPTFGVMHTEDSQLKFTDVDVESEARRIVQEIEHVDEGDSEFSDTDSEMSLDGSTEVDF
jgi:hypothetical protein